MWVVIFGSSTSFRGMGTVAELCPHCRRMGPCAVTCRIEEFHIFFLPFASNTTETNCICGACGGQFPVEQGRYQGFVSTADASAMPIETLAEQTNPLMIEQLQWAQRRQQFADNSDFTAIAEAAEQFGPGQLRATLVQGLQQWDQLDYPRRVKLTKSASDLAGVLRFARTVAAQVPGTTGCLAGALACLMVWSTLLVLRATNDQFLGEVAGLVGVIAGPLLGIGVVIWSQRRRFRRWAVEVLIPEGEKAGIDFAQLAAVLRDPPAPGLTNIDDLRPLREHAETVVSLLVAFGKFEHIPCGKNESGNRTDQEQ